jgi:hypothetical protein
MSKTKEMAMQQNEAVAAEPTRQQSITTTFNSLLGMDAATIDTIARAIVQDVANGDRDALETLIYAKKGAMLFKAIDDNVKNYAYGKQYAAKGENVVKFGCKVEQSELGVSYDYSVTGDTEWEHLKAVATKAKAALDDREKFLKTIKGTMDVVVMGEPITIHEPIKKATLGYKITVK